jgi:hypothetical protein
MDDQRAVPEANEADASEQQIPVDERPPQLDEVPEVGDRPEADVLEQAAVVSTEQAARPPTIPADVPQADALEQSIDEPIDDELRG